MAPRRAGDAMKYLNAFFVIINNLQDDCLFKAVLGAEEPLRINLELFSSPLKLLADYAGELLKL